MPDTRLLDEFRASFEGKKYRHRSSTVGDNIAQHFFEDLYTIQRTPAYMQRVDDAVSVLNTGNTRRGVKARRGDGSFGEILPNADAIRDQGFHVARGPIATIEIGVEVKILMKAMIKQIDRVISDLTRQAKAFKKGNPDAICVGVVGINRAPYSTTYEGDRSHRTDGKGNAHPVDEAEQAEARLTQGASEAYDELLILRFRATNEPPFDFEWHSDRDAKDDYGAVLSRIGRKYRTLFA